MINPFFRGYVVSRVNTFFPQLFIFLIVLQKSLGSLCPISISFLSLPSCKVVMMRTLVLFNSIPLQESLFETDGLNSQRFLISSPTLCRCESTLTASLPTITYSFSPKVRPLRGRLILVHRRRPPTSTAFYFLIQHLLGLFVVWTTLGRPDHSLLLKSFGRPLPLGG